MVFRSDGLFNWRMNELKKSNVRVLFYLSHIDNLKSILQNGILPKNSIDKKNKTYISFADEKVQSLRHKKSIYLSNKSLHNLHDLVPLYFSTRTPTLYARKEQQNEFFYCVIGAYFICKKNINFSFCNGNAASRYTTFYNDLRKLNKLPWEVIYSREWNGSDDYTRQKNSEFLIYPKIHVDSIWSFSVNNRTIKDKICKEIHNLNNVTSGFTNNKEFRKWKSSISTRIQINNDDFF